MQAYAQSLVFFNVTFLTLLCVLMQLVVMWYRKPVRELSLAFCAVPVNTVRGRERTLFVTLSSIVKICYFLLAPQLWMSPQFWAHFKTNVHYKEVKGCSIEWRCGKGGGGEGVVTCSTGVNKWNAQWLFDWHVHGKHSTYLYVHCSSAFQERLRQKRTWSSPLFHYLWCIMFC